MELILLECVGFMIHLLASQSGFFTLDKIHSFPKHTNPIYFGVAYLALLLYGASSSSGPFSHLAGLTRSLARVSLVFSVQTLSAS